MLNIQHYRGRHFLAALLITSTSFSQHVFAQATQSNTQGVEEVYVEGIIRESLRTALEVKRNSNSIVDHISADDISSVPALDLGEALQAIPGIQLNIEGSRRESSVNLRGLPSGYVLTTANGNSFASPSQSRSVNGVGNPFGAFEASIFRGVTVVKSATADLDEGYIAGVIDKKLPQALDRSKDELSVSLGTRYEQLNDSFDPMITARGTKIFSDGVFAITGAIAFSEQNYRRDIVRVNRYEELDSNQFPGLDEYKAANNVPADARLIYPSDGKQTSERANGDRLSAAFNAQWQVTDELKLGLDFLGTRKDLSDGQQDTNTLAFGDRSNLRYFIPPEERTDPNVDRTPARRLGYNSITPTGTPFFGFTKEDSEGNPVDTYAISSFDFDNARFIPDTRLWSQIQETAGVFLTANWERENWTVDTTLSLSQANSDTPTVQLDSRYNAVFPRFNGTRGLLGPNGERASDGEPNSNGFFGSYRTGEGDLDDYSLTFTGADLLDFNNTDRWQYSLNSRQRANPAQEIVRQLQTASVRGASGVNDNSISFVVSAGERFTERSLDTVGTDVTYDFDSDGFFTSVKGGFKFSREKFDNREARNSPGFINLNGISNEFFTEPFHATSTPFFNGNAPGSFTSTSGWRTFDVPLVIQRLQRGPLLTPPDENGNREPILDDDGNPIEYSIEDAYNEFWANGIIQLTEELETLQAIENPTDSQLNDLRNKEAEIDLFLSYEEPQFSSTGFLRVRDDNQNSLNYSSQVDVSALYGMANFETTLFGLYTSGNFGLRYAHTSLESEGLFAFEGTITRSTPTNSYAHFLPSFNMSLELQDDLVVRAAAYRGMVRPNIAAFRPSAGIVVRDTSIRIQEASTNVEPYVGDSIDFTMEWYNRESSALSVGIFAKKVQNGTVTENPCPLDGGDYGFGEFVRDNNDCLQAIPHTFEVFDSRSNGGEFVERTERRRVNIRRTVNTDATGYIRGLELSAQQNLDFLEGFWGGFGGVFNFSYVDTDDSGVITGISETSYNLIGYWENKWLSTRLSYNWRSEYSLQSTSRFTGNELRTVEPRDRLDLSVSFKLPKKTRVTFRAYNLTDYIYQEYQDGNQRLPKRFNYDGRTYSLSISKNFN